MILLRDKSNKCRINAYISKKNYIAIDELMKNERLITMSLSKGAILDIALSNFFRALDVESLENLTIQHLERIEDGNVEEFQKQCYENEREILRSGSDGA